MIIKWSKGLGALAGGGEKEFQEGSLTKARAISAKKESLCPGEILIIESYADGENPLPPLWRTLLDRRLTKTLIREGDG
ncbi:MAG: hypothetical protein A2W01_06505 [Candidatus Solincola sediminis]|uniref:Uncharacterized protein n=1 Tax=Candidatus Solincola sediminis TaxID=1797199 RepID=A0A1F2WNV4_9ACTN|nr:MAG: hypothetical protein A2Y75_02825 [Candidatus Solincola sediminis]OFW59555.1 MAG: hypothetical protein A2W01_06505 [Candidatus Solincola sediminis]